MRRRRRGTKPTLAERASKLSGKRTEGRQACSFARVIRCLVMSNHSSLRELEQHDAFVSRHIGPNDAEVAQMLRTLGFDSLEAMTDAIVPASIKSAQPLAVPSAISEVEAIAKIRALADKN